MLHVGRMLPPPPPLPPLMRVVSAPGRRQFLAYCGALQGASRAAGPADRPAIRPGSSHRANGGATSLGAGAAEPGGEAPLAAARAGPLHHATGAAAAPANRCRRWRAGRPLCRHSSPPVSLPAPTCTRRSRCTPPMTTSPTCWSAGGSTTPTRAAAAASCTRMPSPAGITRAARAPWWAPAPMVSFGESRFSESRLLPQRLVPSWAATSATFRTLCPSTLPACRNDMQWGAGCDQVWGARRAQQGGCGGELGAGVGCAPPSLLPCPEAWPAACCLRDLQVSKAAALNLTTLACCTVKPQSPTLLCAGQDASTGYRQGGKRELRVLHTNIPATAGTHTTNCTPACPCSTFCDCGECSPATAFIRRPSSATLPTGTHCTTCRCEGCAPALPPPPPLEVHSFKLMLAVCVCASCVALLPPAGSGWPS